MIILKHNVLPVDDLFTIERQLLRWLDHKETRVGLDFNILTLGRADIYGHLLGIFTRLGCTDILNITHSDLLDFFIDVDACYHNAPYHSFYHAVDIVFMVYYLLTELGAKMYFPPLDMTALLMAALCHDLGHPGYNNGYQINLETEHARKYNNTSVLESLSCDLFSDLIKKHGVIVHSLVPETRKQWMDKVATMILHTDMVYHYTLQEQAGLLEEEMNKENDDYFTQHHSTTFASRLTFSPQCYSARLNENRIQQLGCILLHAADISNTVRPWTISKQWSDLIVQEFFRQGDLEKRYGLEVSPGMDRDLSTQPDISLTFGDLVVRPYFEVFAQLLPGAHVLLQALDDNREEWIRIKQGQAFDGDALEPIVTETTSLPPPPPPPLGERRVSVAAGTLVIPESIVYGKKSYRAGLRSHSFAVVEKTNYLRKLSHGPIFLQQRATTGYDNIK